MKTIFKKKKETPTTRNSNLFSFASIIRIISQDKGEIRSNQAKDRGWRKAGEREKSTC